jgi:hypothetical protein
MYAILTKYLGPTDSRGSRVSASFSSRRLTIVWDDALNVDENHRAAAQAMLKKLSHESGIEAWACGELPGGGYVWVRK